MALIIGLGSNLGDRLAALDEAQWRLKKFFDFAAASSTYQTPPVDYLLQPDFLNRVIQFKLPALDGHKILQITQSIERQMGSIKKILKGPRLIDIDLLFLGTHKVFSSTLTLPHPSWNQRSFVVTPLKELPYFKTLKEKFPIPAHLGPPIEIFEKARGHTKSPF